MFVIHVVMCSLTMIYVSLYYFASEDTTVADIQCEMNTYYYAFQAVFSGPSGVPCFHTELH